MYADQIEWMSTHFEDREHIILSVHPHNDRGTGVAITEMALRWRRPCGRHTAWQWRAYSKCGHSDRCIQYVFAGYQSELEIEDIKEIVEIYERCCKMHVDMRHPYAGKLVFTAFSGSHQDAINKGVHAMQERGNQYWEVPYLPIDPADIGRKYEPVVRINSQSGKRRCGFVMDTVYGYKLPKMQREFADVIQYISEQEGGEVEPQKMMEAFKKEYFREQRAI